MATKQATPTVISDSASAESRAADLLRFIGARTVMMSSPGTENGDPVTYTPYGSGRMGGPIPWVHCPNDVYRVLLEGDNRLGAKLVEEDPAEGPPSIRLTRSGLAELIRPWLLRASAESAECTSDQAIRNLGAEGAASHYGRTLDRIALECAAELRP
jgi:hypothetical protein